MVATARAPSLRYQEMPLNSFQRYAKTKPDGKPPGFCNLRLEAVTDSRYCTFASVDRKIGRP